MADSIPLFRNAQHHRLNTAIVSNSISYSYGQLLESSARTSGVLLGDSADLNEARVAFLVPPGIDYVATQWGIWRAGGIAVPLGLMHPAAELEYVLDDTGASTVVVESELRDRIEPLAASRSLRVVTTDEAASHEVAALPTIDPSRRAMILYTSGTTSKPKGVVTTHANIQSQIESLICAWGWTSDDHILHVLPLHHTHGITNVLLCALWSGATCEFLYPFDANKVLDRFTRTDLTLFMAVPTIYAKLINAWQQASRETRQAVADGCSQMRLMISGSAALPVSTLHEWQDVSGHVLLERYGMTEIGMALSNPLQGERVPGHVGTPLPNVEVRRVDEGGTVLGEDEQPGEIEVRGPSVFSEYWGKPDATKDSFHNGWFRTGDIAVIENGSYRILGRSNVDIIKSGGYKISALEIEEVLRTHPLIQECAVVGVADEEWGERVGAYVVSDEELELDELRTWAKERLATYKIPTRLLLGDSLPRNAMGKVQKKSIVALF